MRRDQEQCQKRSWLSIAREDLASTAKTHNLDRIITAYEESWEQTNKLPSYRFVYQWPSANHEIFYGEEPRLVPDDMVHFGTRDWGATIMSGLAVQQQLATQAVPIAAQKSPVLEPQNPTMFISDQARGRSNSRSIENRHETRRRGSDMIP